MDQQYDPDDVKQVYRLFSQWDRNRDGVVSIDELRHVLRTLDPTYSDFDITRMFDAADTNQNGVIEVEEFIKWVFDQQSQEAKSQQASQDVQAAERATISKSSDDSHRSLSAYTYNPYTDDVPESPHSGADSPAVKDGQRSNREVEEDQERPDENLTWLSTFHELSAGSNGLMLYSKVSKALELLGYLPVDFSLLDECMQEVTGMTQPEILDRPTFGCVFTAYSNAQEREWSICFNRHDTNADGHISRSEFSQVVMEELDFAMFPYVIDEVFSEICGGFSGRMDRSSFVKALQTLENRHGFSKSEICDLRRVFQKFASKDGRLLVARLRAALSWIGYSAKTNDLVALASTIIRDDHSSTEADYSSISHVHFPLFVRKYREKELKKVGKRFGKHDRDYSGTIDRSELPALVSSLTFLDPKVLGEMIEAAGLTKVENMLFEDFWKLWLHIRSSGGFSREEIAKHEQTFERYALPLSKLVKRYTKSSSLLNLESLERLMQHDTETKHDKHIHISQLGRALRWLGITCNSTKLHSLVEEADVEDTHTLDYEEFNKVLQILRGEMVEEIRTICDKEVKGKAPGTVDPANPVFGGLLRRLHLRPTKATMEKALQDLETNSLDMLGCFQFVNVVRDLAADNTQHNAGFTDSQLWKWQQRFNQFDPDSKTADQVLIQTFIERIDRVFDKTPKDEIQRILDDCLAGGEVNAEQCIDFPEFLILMRAHTDRLESERLRQERDKRKKQEAQRMSDLQEIFSLADQDKSGQLSVEEVKDLIGGVLGDAINRPEVQSRLRMLLCEIDSDASGKLNFDEFSTLILCLEEENLAGINDKAKKIVNS